MLFRKNKELAKKEKLLNKELKEHNNLMNKAFEDSQIYYAKSQQTFGAESNKYFELADKALKDYEYYKNLQTIDIKNIQNLHSSNANTTSINKEEDKLGKGYSLIVGGLLYLAENYNEPSYKLTSHLYKEGISDLNLYIDAIKAEAKDLPASRLQALEEGANFLSSFAVNSILVNPQNGNTNAKDLDKSPIFDLLQRITGDKKFTKAYFDKVNNEVDNLLNTEEFENLL